MCGSSALLSYGSGGSSNAMRLLLGWVFSPKPARKLGRGGGVVKRRPGIGRGAAARPPPRPRDGEEAERRRERERHRDDPALALAGALEEMRLHEALALPHLVPA